MAYARLTERQRAFVDAFVLHGNKTRAYAEAGYAARGASAAACAYKLSKRPLVAQAIEEMRLTTREKMAAGELELGGASRALAAAAGQALATAAEAERDQRQASFLGELESRAEEVALEKDEALGILGRIARKAEGDKTKIQAIREASNIEGWAPTRAAPVVVNQIRVSLDQLEAAVL